MFRKVLVANRGEIACRIAAVCRQLGVRTVAVHSEAEAAARHVRLMDEAVAIGAPRVQDSYLNGERIIEAARQSGAEAVHPGYGLLSENADFARRCEEAGLVFVGPPAEVIATLGDKTRARELAERVGVPVLPGAAAFGADADVARAAERIGYPVMIKAVFGGGGIGMGRAGDARQLLALLRRARDRARVAFGRPDIYLEACLEPARHVEIQVLFDGAGRGVHLHERECSVQRRHQKVVEETPSPLLEAHPALRRRMTEAALAVCRAAGYRNAGTVEFLVAADGSAFYFLEMNTRLQVEHPVTECVTGVPLIEWQLRLAAGERLRLAQDAIESVGAAIQCRLYAEDPERQYLPQPGALRRVVWPGGRGVRVDAGYDAGDDVTPWYDPLLAKIVTCGRTRETARERMAAALATLEVEGLVTNRALLARLMAHEAFAAGALHTRLLEELGRPEAKA